MTDEDLALIYTEPFRNRISQVLNFRSVFVTCHGFIGVGPIDTKAGDKVAILLGADVPFILREESGGEDHRYWKLVGDCYVHGIMGGEVVEYLRREMGRQRSGDEHYYGPQIHDFEIH